MTKFCPLQSTRTEHVACTEDCALYATNKQCAILNLGNVNIETAATKIASAIDGIPVLTARD